MINNLVFEILKLRIKQELPKERSVDFSFVEEFDENSLRVILDCSGFDIELIQDSLTELMALDRSWKSVKNGKTLTGLISQPSIKVDDNKTIFTMLKSDLLKLSLD